MEYHSKPSPACTELIKKWEAAFDVSMPADLKGVLLESDGPVLYDVEIGKELQFLSVKDAIEYYEAYKFEEVCENAIPISMDGCDNFVVYKLEKGEIGSVYAISSMNMVWHDAVLLQQNIAEVIQMEQCVEEVLFSEQGNVPDRQDSASNELLAIKQLHRS